MAMFITAVPVVGTPAVVVALLSGVLLGWCLAQWRQS